MMQRMNTYAVSSHMEIIKTRESRVVEIEKIEVTQKQSSLHIAAQSGNVKHSPAGNFDDGKGRYIDLYA